MRLFHLFGRSAGPAPRRRAVLSVIPLDDRTVPSAVVPTADGVATAAPITAPFAIVAQNVGDGDEDWAGLRISLDARESALGWFYFYGQVVSSNGNAGGLTVTLGGGTSVTGQTTTTGADGSFSIMCEVLTDGMDTGWVTATVSDGLFEAEAEVFIQPTMR